ncbi:MAG: SPASM domain-containing protein [Oscillospiraceae bacterium]
MHHARHAARENTKCASCAYFELCNGGCRAVALALTGDKLGVDPSKCLFWERGYHKKIEALLPQYHTVYTGL